MLLLERGRRTTPLLLEEFAWKYVDRSVNDGVLFSADYCDGATIMLFLS